MTSFLNIFWLGLKELRSLVSDLVMILFVVYAFTVDDLRPGDGHFE